MSSHEIKKKLEKNMIPDIELFKKIPIPKECL